MRYEVPVMVTFDSDEPTDSAVVAASLHDTYFNDVGEPVDYRIVSIDGVPADPDHPNSPPVAATPVTRNVKVDVSFSIHVPDTYALKSSGLAQDIREGVPGEVKGLTLVVDDETEVRE